MMVVNLPKFGFLAFLFSMLLTTGCSFSREALTARQTRVLLPSKHATFAKRQRAFQKNKLAVIFGHYKGIALRNGVVLKEPVDLLEVARDNKKLQKKLFALQAEREKARIMTVLGSSAAITGGLSVVTTAIYILSSDTMLQKSQHQATVKENSLSFSHPMMILGAVGAATFTAGYVTGLVGWSRSKKVERAKAKVFRRYPKLLKKRLLSEKEASL